MLSSRRHHVLIEILPAWFDKSASSLAEDGRSAVPCRQAQRSTSFSGPGPPERGRTNRVVELSFDLYRHATGGSRSERGNAPFLLARAGVISPSLRPSLHHPPADE